ncbi:MAG: DMT family transporter [Nitrospina sp.]|jgi:drug/metabolite transporter (DMT)-like permease|nr:DMT family transporter [Deltaproteobacteria bacterium]MBT6661782.1 DMT family transporter [Nitrospina sp.]MBT7522165.1 DMT family transporter [Nitrospina sp.]
MFTMVSNLVNKPNSFLIKTILFTGLALIAFAANSVLCRLALGGSAIDASTFTIVRLLSGVIVLTVILNISKINSNSSPSTKGSWPASIALFLYAFTFSFAYVTLETATGALILFGSVQITMILLTIFSGNRLHISEWVGMAIAFAGFVYLVLPGVTTPSVIGFFLMTVSGIAWGVYTLKGRGSKSPIMDTAYNFLRTLPFVIILAIITMKYAHYSAEGILLAALSGGIASGIGYMIWYIALSGLSVTQAAVLQLLVPVIAAFGGIIFVSESISLRLAVSSTMILGGILMVVLGRYYYVQLQTGGKT